MIDSHAKSDRPWPGLPAVILTGLLLSGWLSGCGDPAADLPTATGSHQSLVTLVPVSGAGQCAEPDSPLQDEFAVMVLDDEDRPVPGVAVDWRVTRGGGDLSAVRSITDERGRAAVKYALGPWTETNAVRASAVGSSASGARIAFFAGALEHDGTQRLVFEQANPDSRPDRRGLFHHSRYVLYGDGTFEFETETEAGVGSVYTGEYSRSDSLITFGFYWGRASGVIDGSRLAVELDPAALLSDYPGDGVYLLCSIH